MRLPARVSAPVVSNDDDAVAPNFATEPRMVEEKRLVAVALVVVRPPLNARRVFVAFEGKR